MSHNQLLDKKSEVIIATYDKDLTEQNMKLFNHVLYQYQKTRNKTIELNVADLVSLGLIEDTSRKEQISAVSNLMKIQITINQLEQNNKYYDEKRKLLLISRSKIMNIFSTGDVAEVKHEITGKLYKLFSIEFNPQFVDLLESNLFYTRLDLDVINKLNKYGIRLYEILSSLAPCSPWSGQNQHTRKVTIDINKLKEMFGIDKKSIYIETHRFLNNLLKLACENIFKNVSLTENINLSKIGESKRYFETIKHGQSVVAVVFTVSIPKGTKKTGIEKEYTEQEKLFFEERDALKAKVIADNKLLQIAKKKKQLKEANS